MKISMPVFAFSLVVLILAPQAWHCIPALRIGLLDELDKAAQFLTPLHIQYGRVIATLALIGFTVTHTGWMLSRRSK